RPDAVRQRYVAGPPGPSQLAPEDEERHQPEPEDRRGYPEERESHRGAADPGSSLDGRDDADRDAHDEPERRGAGDQPERARRALEDLGLHRLEVPVRVAEPGPAVLVAADERLHEVAELDVERLVQMQPLVDLLDLVRPRRLAPHPPPRVPGPHPH